MARTVPWPKKLWRTSVPTGKPSASPPCCRTGDLDRLAAYCEAPRVRAVIEQVGDIDYPSRLVLPMLAAEPRFIGLFLRGWRHGA